MAAAPPPNPYQPQPDLDTQRAEASKRLAAAKKSMIFSIGLSLLLLAYVVWRISYTYSNPALRGNSSVLIVIVLIVLARLAYNGYRLYNKWKVLQAAQEHHRSLHEPS